MANKKPLSGAGRPMLQRAAIYVRVSTHWQIDKDSLPVQREELVNYCKYALNLDSFEIFEDAGYSAKNTERPAYQQMMARLRTGEFSHIVVWKIDRISRNLIDFATMYEEMKRLGIAFVSKNEQFDTSSAMGEAMLKIILVFAELERKVTSERVTAVMLSRAANGQWNGGRVTYGYSYDKETDKFNVVENESAIVRMIFDMYEMERSLVNVAKTLNEKGLKTRRGVAWGPVSVQGILRNPFYIGTYRYNYRDANSKYTGHDFKPKDEWVMVEDHHIPLIDRDQWEKVSAILTENRRIVGNGSTYNRKNLHIFAGLIRCGNCGSNMTASPDRKRNGGWRPSVYTCSRRKRFSDCPNKYVSDVTLGPFALNYIANMMKAQKSFGASTSIETLEKKLLRGKQLADVEHIEGIGLQEIYDALRRQKIPEVLDQTDSRETKVAEHETKEIDLLVSERRRSERALTRLQNLFLYGEAGISEKDYIAERKRIADELASLDARMEELDKDRSTHFSISDDEFIEKIDYFILSQELLDKREVNYEKLIRETEPVIIKDFLNSIAQNFCIKDGRIESIRFKNGVEHRFLYKDEE
jgi:DNA invertase Pin-like site-specific DNA recombinase